MTLPNLSNIPRWQLIASIVTLALTLYTVQAIYWDAHGWNRADQQWRQNIADGKLNTVKVETTFVAVKPDSGHFASTSATASAEYQARVDKIISTSALAIGRYITENDSLRQSNSQLKSQLQLAYSPRLIHLNTPLIGDLILQYFPADDSANVYRHLPPLQKVIIEYRDRIVLEPRSDWETAGYITLGTGIGILAAVIAHIK